jgi:hypothetical protein
MENAEQEETSSHYENIWATNCSGKKKKKKLLGCKLKNGASNVSAFSHISPNQRIKHHVR